MELEDFAISVGCQELSDDLLFGSLFLVSQFLTVFGDFFRTGKKCCLASRVVFLGWDTGRRTQRREEGRPGMEVGVLEIGAQAEEPHSTGSPPEMFQRDFDPGNLSAHCMTRQAQGSVV